MAYSVTPSEVVNNFNVSASFQAGNVSGNIVAATIYMQPWDNYPQAAIGVSQSLPNMTGTVQLEGTKTENYAVLTSGGLFSYGYTLFQDNVTDDGELLVLDL